MNGCSYPEIEREEITRPIFIVGINRTGTTYLHRLMARDPRFWSLRGYEYAAPVLSKEEYATIGGTPDDPRRARVEEMLESSRVVEIFKGVHDFNLDEPAQDFPILSMDFGSWTSTVRFHVPQFGRWLAATGSQHAYSHHRRIMQHYNWQRRQRQPGHLGQWLFKMPFHLMELETLVETYPDALFIQTHRSPSQFMGSWNSFVEKAHSLSLHPEPRFRTIGIHERNDGQRRAFPGNPSRTGASLDGRELRRSGGGSAGRGAQYL